MEKSKIRSTLVYLSQWIGRDRTQKKDCEIIAERFTENEKVNLFITLLVVTAILLITVPVVVIIAYPIFFGIGYLQSRYGD